MSMILANGAAPFALPMNDNVIGLRPYLDPLDEDRSDDIVVVTTRRAICRVALVAAETAGRFQREAVPHDPMSWMLAPRSLFGGSSAIEACLDRDACLRGILLHGLSLGLDADPSAIDALADDEDDDEFADRRHAASAPDDLMKVDIGFNDRRSNVVPITATEENRVRLFTATVVSSDGGECVQAFHASLAADEAEVSERLRVRIGSAAAHAIIVDGFDPSEPLVAALVSDAICDSLEICLADPNSPIAAGLDLNIEQRFHG